MFFPRASVFLANEMSARAQEWRQAPGAPPTPEELGNAGWTVLHTAAAAFPNKPSSDQQEAMRQFILSWSKVYACSHCAYHMRTVLQSKPPVVTSKRDVSQFVCELHNDVNHMLGKEQYDCRPDAVLRRWHPTYPEMDDVPTIEEQIEAERREREQKKSSASSGSAGWWRQSSSSGTATQQSSGSKVRDDETNVDAVLARLKGCQVYCPEKH